MKGILEQELIYELILLFYRIPGFMLFSYGFRKTSHKWLRAVFILSGIAVLYLSGEIDINHEITLRNLLFILLILLICIICELFGSRFLPDTESSPSGQIPWTQKDPKLVEQLLSGAIFCIVLLFGLGYISKYASFRFYVLMLVIMFAGILGAGNAGLYPASEKRIWWSGYVLSLSSVLCILPFYNGAIMLLQCVVTAVLLWMYRKEREKQTT